MKLATAEDEAADLAAEIGPGLAKAALIAEIDGAEADLDVPLTDLYAKENRQT